ncbi:MAG: hypothetical protein A4E49_02757 [Methanosaeta sp. PtaU1.Bin112]|nr:MAG: hypothetical protein A4E49_02757 [Methanosaeta sp. PtaU1.Bin112]
MKISAVLGMIFFLAAVSLASADTEKISAGPFEVSFDLNTTENHTVEALGPAETNESIGYTVMIDFAGKSTVGIYISKANEVEDASLNSLKEVLASKLTDDPDASVEIGTIDGKDGVIGFGLPIYDENLLKIENETSFEYVYWLDSEKCECGPVYVGKTQVRVVGPWISEWDDAIAISLLDSLKITETA